ncbi:hypothetical protein K474DRAFT_1556721, partial [Panus rudis PR-1116 ss-1]
PLVCVEWFTQFRTRDDVTGMFSVKPSSRNHCPRTSVIPLSHIFRSCHLIPVWG